MVADPLDLAEEVRRDDDGDPELGAGPVDELEHLVAAGRVEAVRRLVEQEQTWVVDERLGELDPLLHAGRVAADRAVALLVQPDVAEDLGGPLAGGRPRQPGDQGQVRDEVGGGRVGRKAIVLGHVAHELADRRSRASLTSRSKTVAVPDVGSRSPSRILSSVLLPAPLEPTRPTIPGSMSSVSASSAVTVAPYRLVRFRIEINVTA